MKLQKKLYIVSNIKQGNSASGWRTLKCLGVTVNQKS